MIVRFFKTGISNGETPVRYLMRATDHAGNARPEVPEVLEGSPETTVTIINSIGRKHKYASGCLAFRPDEKPNKAQLLNILDQFKALVAPGLEPEQFNALFVLHHETPDPKTGQSGFHVHFLLPMTLLGGVNAKGKRLAGKRWNPHPPGKQTIEVMSLFTQITNHENGWQPVQEKPTRVGMDALWRKITHLDQKRKIEVLHVEVLKAIKGEQVHNRQELMTFMEDELGLTVTRASEKTVSVRFPGTHKAVRLKGAAYEYSADYKQITSQSKTDGEQPNIDQAKERLAELLRQRAQHITDTPKTTKRKEQVYGKQSSNRRSTAGPEKAHARGGLPPHGASQHPHRAHQHPHVSGRMGGNLLEKSGRLRPCSYEQRHPKNGKGLGNAPNQPQQVDQLRQDARESGARTGRQWWGRPLTAFNPLAEIDEQIRALSIELNDCPIGSSDAKTIDEQLNRLRGAREQAAHAQPQRLKSKPRR